MPPEDRRLVLEFFEGALVRVRHMEPLKARVHAGYLLARLLELAPAALRETIDLCARADDWEAEWQQASRSVRRAVSRYYTLQPGYSLGSARTRHPVREDESGEAARADEEAHAFAELEAMVRGELEQIDALEGWLQSGRSLDAFLDLWELPGA